MTGVLLFRQPLATVLLLVTFAFSSGEAARGQSLTITETGGAVLQGWTGEVRVVRISRRCASLSIVPEMIGETTLTLRVPGLDEEEYALCVSGKEPRLLTAKELSLGTQVAIPQVVGAKAARVYRDAMEWRRRVEGALVVADSYGYGEDILPKEFVGIVQQVYAAGEGLAEAASSQAAVLRIVPVDAGAVDLPALSALSIEEMEAKNKQLQKWTGIFLKVISEIEEDPIRQDALEELIPIHLGNPTGRAVRLAKKGEAGTGTLRFAITNPEVNPALSVALHPKTPTGWRPIGKSSRTLKLAPGRTEKYVAEFEIARTEPGGRVAIPLEMKIEAGGLSVERTSGVGFGHDFIMNWRVIGPFPNKMNSAMDILYPPEEGSVDLAAQYEGMAGEVGWREVPTKTNGYLDLANAMEPNTNSVAYAVVWVYSPLTQTAICAAGCNDAMKVWMNDDEVYRLPGERGAAPEADIFSARLNRGWNRLMVKSLQTGGNWGIYFELRDKTGAPLPGAEFSTEPPD